MTIAPINLTTTINAPLAKCFEAFTARIGEWWPKNQTLSRGDYKTLVVEPKVGGRWYETDANDQVIQWGEVSTWEPPQRLQLIWRLNTKFQYDPSLHTVVEITFKDMGDGKTKMTLEHRNLEKLGADAEQFVGMLKGGWEGHMKTMTDFVEAQK